jgi:predicted RNase H-like HicB family nuclease
VAASRTEVEKLIREAIEAHLGALHDLGMPVPEPSHEVGEVQVSAS